MVTLQKRTHTHFFLKVERNTIRHDGDMIVNIITLKMFVKREISWVLLKVALLLCSDFLNLFISQGEGKITIFVAVKWGLNLLELKQLAYKGPYNYGTFPKGEDG